MNVCFCSSNGDNEIISRNVNSLEQAVKVIRSDLSERMPFYKNYNMHIIELEVYPFRPKEYRVEFGGGYQYYMITSDSEKEYRIDFSKVDWPDHEKLTYLQRRIIVHSILYYEMDVSIISDQRFDALARQTEEMMKTLPLEECKKSRYWYCMSNFDGATGFDLYSRLTPEDKTRLLGIARIVLEQWQLRKEET